MNSKKNNSLYKLISYETFRLFYIFIGATLISVVVSAIKSVSLIMQYQEFNLYIKRGVPQNATRDYQSILYELESNFIDTFDFSIGIIAFLAGIIGLYVIISEFNFKNKHGYTLLMLPVKRWKIFLAKFIQPLLFFVINYFLAIVIALCTGVGAINALSGKYRIYIENNLLSLDFFYIENFILASINILLGICTIFLIVIASKSLKKSKFIGLLLLEILFVFIGSSIVFENSYIETAVIVSYIAIALSISFYLFEKKLEV